MNLRHALLGPLACASLALPTPAAPAPLAPAPLAPGDLVLGLARSNGRTHLGVAIHSGPSHGWGLHPGGYVRFHPFHPAPPPRRIWIPAHSEVVHTQVYVPGAQRKVWSPARYETRIDPWGRRHTVQVSPGHWQVVQEPGRWQVVSRTVHHPGRWGTRY